MGASHHNCVEPAQTCHNVPGSYICVCNRGYRENNDGECEGSFTLILLALKFAVRLFQESISTVKTILIYMQNCLYIYLVCLPRRRFVIKVIDFSFLKISMNVKSSLTVAIRTELCV